MKLLIFLFPQLHLWKKSLANMSSFFRHEIKGWKKKTLAVCIADDLILFSCICSLVELVTNTFNAVGWNATCNVMGFRFIFRWMLNICIKLVSKVSHYMLHRQKKALKTYSLVIWSYLASSKCASMSKICFEINNIEKTTQQLYLPYLIPAEMIMLLLTVQLYCTAYFKYLKL